LAVLFGWWFGLAVMHWSRSTKLLYGGPDGLVSTWMGDCLQAHKLSRYVTFTAVDSAFYPL